MPKRKTTVVLVLVVVIVATLGAIVFWAMRSAETGDHDRHPEEVNIGTPGDDTTHLEEYWDEERRRTATPLPMPVETQ